MQSTVYNVSFPKFNVYLQVNPIALHFSGFTVYWYGVILAAGFLLGFLYINRRAKEFGFTKNEISDVVLILSVCAIFCARLYYVLFYPGDFYLKNPIKIFMISEGGIAIYGAVIGGVLGVWVFSWVTKKSVFKLLDIMALGLTIGQVVGRWGNFVNQEAFGTETLALWGMASENTYFKTVHPCFLYESLGCLLIFVFLHFYSKNKRADGNIFVLYIIFYGLLRAVIEGLRTDSLIIPYTTIRISQLLAVISCLCSLIIFVNKKVRSSK